MRVALLDPSLFTLPYDSALAAALTAAGDHVVLHGRRADPDRDGEAGGAEISGGFYRVADRSNVRAMPDPLRLAIKGVDHGVSLLGLLRRMAAERPDVIHVQWLPLPLLDRPALHALHLLAPLVLTVHDTEPFNGNPASFLQRFGQAGALNLFDRLIVHTEQGAARLQARGLGRDRVAILPHGAYAPTPVLAPANGDVEFLLFGKIKPYKGPDLLIEAFARMAPAVRQRARVHIAGKPYMDLKPLQQLASRLGIADRVRISPGFIADADIAAHFGANTVAVFPYREIEASGVLALAASHGAPMIATGLGSFAETLTDGVHGRLVPRGDVATLAAAMQDMVLDPNFRQRAAVAVAQLARAWPEWREVAEKTRLVYQEARRQWLARHRVRAETASLELL